MTIQFDQITRIEAYKVDLFTVDEIRWDIHSIDGRCTTISEEAPDWDDVTRAIASLPGFMDDWYEKVSQPPFAENRLVIYTNEAL